MLIEPDGKNTLNIDLFKREHAHIFADIIKLRGLVQSEVSENVLAIVDQLAATHEMISRHLQAEDRILYPALARALDPATAQMSRRFQREMGDLLMIYTAFAARWNSSAQIVADAQAFRDDAAAVLNALHHRAQRENRELYPLAERLGESGPRHRPSR